MNAVRSSHLALRKQPVNDKRDLEREAIVRFDEYVNFARTHRQELKCKSPPCLLQNDYVDSLTYLLMSVMRDESPVMRELYWFVHSDKASVIQSEIQHKEDVDTELTYTPYVGIYQVSDDMQVRYPDTASFMMSAIQPLKTFVDILLALKHQ